MSTLAIVAALLLLLGLIVEVTGIVLMARPFVSVPMKDIPMILLSALGRGEDAKGSTEIAALVGERPLDFIQGLAFASAGILLQIVGTGLETLVRVSGH